MSKVFNNSNKFVFILIKLQLITNLFNGFFIDNSLAQQNNDSFPPFVHRYVSSVVFSPNYDNDNTLFATVSQGGVFKSEDNGNSWFSIHSGIDEKYFLNLKVVVSPNYDIDNTLFVWAGINKSNSTNKIFKSYDGGKSWNEVLSGVALITIDISAQFQTNYTILVGADGGNIYKSTDAGITWEEMPQKIFCPLSFAFSPDFHIDSSIFCGNQGLGFSLVLGNIYKSIDAANSWTKVDSARVLSVNSLSISPIYGTDHTVFAGNSLGGITKSIDEGLTWDFANVGINHFDVGSVEISKNFENDHILFIATSGGVYKSIDAGGSWNLTNSGITDRNTETIAISPNFQFDQTIIVGSHGGIFRSTNRGDSWTPINNGIPISDFINISNNPDIISTLASLAVDNSGYVHIAFNGTYIEPEAPDGITTDIFYTTNKSGSFIEPQIVQVPPGYGYYSKSVHIVTDRNRFAHIAFERAQSSGGYGYVFYATNKTGSWISELVSEGYGGAHDPFLGVDSFGTIHLIFETWSNYYTSKPANDEFQTPVKFADEGRSTQHTMVVSPDGTVHVAYHGSIFGPLSYIKGKDGHFSEKITIPGDIDANDISMDLDSNSEVHIVFSNGTNIYYTTNASSDSFEVPLHVGTIYRASHPVISISPDDSVFVADIDGNYLYCKNGNDFEKISLTKVDVSSYTGKSFFDIGGDGVAHFVYQYPPNRIIGSFSYNIYYFNFSLVENFPLLNISTSNLDFGDIEINQSKDSTIVISNIGTGDLIINSISIFQDISDFSILSPTSFPVTIKPNSAPLNVIVNFSPSSTGDKRDTLIINSNDPNNYIAYVTLIGNGVIETNVYSQEIYDIPITFGLDQNYPNPFNPLTTIQYQLPKASEVKLIIYNLQGQLVTILVDKLQQAGFYSAQWDGKDEFGKYVSSGVYLYKLETNELIKIRKLTLLH